MEPTVRTLLLNIARCTNLEACKTSPEHPCSRIVGAQQVGQAALHLPEPWSGDIEMAPILFVSSNPGGSADELFPTWGWPDDDLVDYFANRFGGGRKPWILDGNRRLNLDGKHSGARPYWSNIKKRAREILGREPVPGVDYAITEIVHCKSRQEIGVTEALAECSGRFLRRVLRASAAAVIVAVGGKVRRHLLEELDLRGAGALLGPQPLEGKERVVLCLGHPAGPKPKRLGNCLSAAEIQRLRQFVAERP